MIIRWSRIIDAIASYFIRKAETKPEKTDKRVTVITRGDKQFTIN